MKTLALCALLVLSSGCLAERQEIEQTTSSTSSTAPSESPFPSIPSQSESPPSSTTTSTSSSASSSSSSTTRPPPSCTNCFTVTAAYFKASDGCQNMKDYDGWYIDVEERPERFQIKDAWVGQFKQFAANGAELDLKWEVGSLDQECDRITEYREV